MWNNKGDTLIAGKKFKACKTKPSVMEQVLLPQQLVSKSGRKEWWGIRVRSKSDEIFAADGEA